MEAIFAVRLVESLLVSHGKEVLQLQPPGLVRGGKGGREGREGRERDKGWSKARRGGREGRERGRDERKGGSAKSNVCVYKYRERET